MFFFTMATIREYKYIDSISLRLVHIFRCCECLVLSLFPAGLLIGHLIKRQAMTDSTRVAVASRAACLRCLFVYLSPKSLPTVTFEDKDKDMDVYLTIRYNNI